jgi:lipopolysaccharide/colanic/teichoic acid biosynthesis glycosyltransferase
MLWDVMVWGIPGVFVQELMRHKLFNFIRLGVITKNRKRECWHIYCLCIYIVVCYYRNLIMDKKPQKRIQGLIAVATLILMLGSVSAGLVWAALPIVNTVNGSGELTDAPVVNISRTVPDGDIDPSITRDKKLNETKSRAPEPTTLALFGTGILGFITRFVRKTYHLAKRAMDVMGAAILLIISAPLFVLASILIKWTSRGPVVYTQERVGRNGVPFTIYKFRTMRINAEKETGPVWAKENDNRLTPVGKFLRTTHIDELPQLFNVFQGDMSLIGPRPERPKFVEDFSRMIPDYPKRLTIKPGITGLAQVRHRYDETIEDVRKKIKYDLLYIRKMCLLTDLRIAARTLRVIFTGEGAR